MGRRMPSAVMSVSAGVVLLTVAASSGPLRIWATPTEVRDPATQGSGPIAIGPSSPLPSDRIALPPWIMSLLLVLGVLLVLLAVAALVSVRVARPFASFGRRRLRWGAGRAVAPLPELTDPELTVDVRAARAALSEGDPRNAIIGCWMQLERDTSNVGLQRMIAETPAEYVERVIVASSVDPVPIQELAALYREARFSRHKLGDADRAHALDALHRVAGSLRSKHRVST